MVYITKPSHPCGYPAKASKGQQLYHIQYHNSSRRHNNFQYLNSLTCRSKKVSLYKYLLPSPPCFPIYAVTISTKPAHLIYPIPNLDFSDTRQTKEKGCREEQSEMVEM